MHETFWSLMHDPAHLEFEIVLSIVQDMLIFLVARAWSRREHALHRSTHRKEARVEWAIPSTPFSMNSTSHVRVIGTTPVSADNGTTSSTDPAIVSSTPATEALSALS
jgi:hypothetical protein